jgi:glyoxylase-like metal-dependent hydrolase (beta-lactamase superfamily II)
LKTALGGAAGIVLGASFLGAQTAPPAAGAERLADDLFIVRLPGEANVVVQTSPNGALLVDGASAKGSDALMKAVAELPGGSTRIHTLFNTHWHPEQTGSNERLGKAGTPIVAHENTRLWLGQNVKWPWAKNTVPKLPKIAQPNKTFYDKGQLESGVRYGWIADAAHTDGDIYVYFPTQNVLAVGDAVTGQGWPEPDWWSGGWLGGIVGGLQRLQSVANAQTRIVPARGGLLSVADLNTQLEMYGALYTQMSQMMTRGRGPSDAVAEKPLKDHEAKMGNSDAFVRRAFESLWAYQSPDA